MSEYAFICKDAVKFLQDTPPESVDLVIIDPPYNSLQKYRSIGTTTRLKKFFPVVSDDYLFDVISLIFLVMKKNSHFYCFCNFDHLPIIKNFGEEVGFKCWKALVWDKQRIGMGYHYRSRHEYILFFEKGKKKLNNLSIPDVLTYKAPYRKYPTQKPVDLLKVLIEQSSSKGDIVLDCFCGAGSTGVAAVQTGRNFVGCDISEEAFNITTNRIEGI